MTEILIDFFIGAVVIPVVFLISTVLLAGGIFSVVWLFGYHPVIFLVICILSGIWNVIDS